MDEIKESTVTITNSLKKQTTKEDNMIENEEEEEESSEIQIQSNENTMNDSAIKNQQKETLMDEVTQTDSTIFEKIQNDFSVKNQVDSSTQVDNNQNQFENFMEREFYPQFKANEGKIDSQIEKIDQAIEKLRFLTKNFNQNIDITPSTSTSASIDHLSEFPMDNLIDNNSIQTTPKKAGKKIKKKAASKSATPLSKPIFDSPNIKRKTRKRSIKKHKRFLSPLKMTTEKRMELLNKKKSPNKNSPENNIFIPKGLSSFDPIVLRSGYPIVFNYDPSDPIRHERIPHGPMKTLYKNGDIKYEFHDGTVRIKAHNGFAYTYYTNGDKQQEFPDGVNAYRYNSNGSVEFRCLDNTLMYFFENGQIEEHFSNGETRVRFPDRSEIKILVDNSFVFKDKNGNKKTGKIFNNHSKKKSVNSPGDGSSSGISTPTPRTQIPVSTNIDSPNSKTKDKIQNNDVND